MKYKLKKILLTISFSIIISGCNYNNQTENNQTEYEYSETESTSQISQISEETTVEKVDTDENKKNIKINIGENLPITRGLAAKMIALSFGKKEEINSLERTVEFTDVSPEKWYSNYINFVCTKKYISGMGDKFMPDEYLSVIQAQYIADQIDKNNKIKINITEETKDKPISYNLWTEIYMKVLKNIAGKSSIKEKFGINAQKAVILALNSNNKFMKEGFVVTDKGLLRCSGIDLSDFIDKEISFWTKENEIIALSDIISESPTIKNSYIVKNENVCTIFSGGAEKTYDKAENFSQTDKESVIADVKLDEGKILSIDFKGDVKEKQIKNISNNKLICVDDEIFDVEEEFKVYYRQKDKIMLGSQEDIIEGKTYELYLKDNKICAFIFTKF